jgi:glucokinase
MLVGIDIGGTKVEIVQMTLGLNIISSFSIPTSTCRRGSEQFLDDIIELLKPFITEEVQALGVSVRFPICNGITLYSSLLGGSVKIPIQERLQNALNIPVVIDDDLHSHAKGEWGLGRGRECENFVLLNLGTGIGVSLVNQVPLTGSKNCAGFICLEQYWIPELDSYFIADQLICGNGLSLLYQQFSLPPNKRKATPIGNYPPSDAKSAKEIFESLSSDPISEQVYRVFVRTLGKLLAQITFFYDPEEIVIVGSLKHALNLFKKDSEQHAKKLFLTPFLEVPPILASTVSHAASRGVFIGTEYHQNKFTS